MMMITDEANLLQKSLLFDNLMLTVFPFDTLKHDILLLIRKGSRVTENRTAKKRKAEEGTM